MNINPTDLPVDLPVDLIAPLYNPATFAKRGAVDALLAEVRKNTR